MKRDSSKLFIMAGSLLGVVLLTAAVIYSYGGQNAASRRSARLPAPSPQIIRQLLSQSTRLFEEKRYPEFTKVVLLAFKPLLHTLFFEKNVKLIVLLL